MRRLINHFEKPESLKPSKDLFIELRHMYSDYRWRRASGGRDARDPGDDRARAGEMDEADRDGVMRDIRAIYMRDDSVLKSSVYEPVVEYLCNKDNKIRGEHPHDALFVRPNFVLTL